MEVISRFGRLEFGEGGSEEVGKTLFESLLASYPKRADIWGLYVDALLKRSLVQEAR